MVFAHLGHSSPALLTKSARVGVVLKMVFVNPRVPLDPSAARATRNAPTAVVLKMVFADPRGHPLETSPARATRSAPAAVVLEGQGPIKLVFAYPLKPRAAKGTTSAPAAFVLEGQKPIQMVFVNPSVTAHGVMQMMLSKIVRTYASFVPRCIQASAMVPASSNPAVPAAIITIPKTPPASAGL